MCAIGPDVERSPPTPAPTVAILASLYHSPEGAFWSVTSDIFALGFVILVATLPPVSSTEINSDFVIFLYHGASPVFGAFLFACTLGAAKGAGGLVATLLSHPLFGTLGTYAFEAYIVQVISTSPASLSSSVPFHLPTTY